MTPEREREARCRGARRTPAGVARPARPADAVLDDREWRTQEIRLVRAIGALDFIEP